MLSTKNGYNTYYNNIIGVLYYIVIYNYRINQFGLSYLYALMQHNKPNAAAITPYTERVNKCNNNNM